jgi:SIR2-like domain
MFRVSTVFVIGAGAGVDVSMPLGDQLSRMIGEKLRITSEGGQQTGGDSLIMEAIRKHAATNKKDAKLYCRVAFSVAGGIAYSRSIDSYLHAHKDNKPLQVCGKLAIARTILEHEKDSALAVQKGREFRNATKVNNSWLVAFMNSLQDRIVVSESLEDIFKHLTIVNFNYDRCVEHFLFHAMQAWSLKNEQEVAELMKGLNIYHPYGSVGDLPWQSGEGIEFGAEVDACGLLKSSLRIRTFNEEVEDRTKIKEIQDAMCTANRVIFLGFHFHQQNVDLITPPNAQSGTASAYATAYNRSDHDKRFIYQQILKMGMKECLIDNWDCPHLFREFQTTWLG